ncbi:glycoside hydrolase family 65 protein [Marinifilum caeruleilacunae]|uniref:Glycoside hydrolase family 65 protein n=1 Tax=Marinifilum caeruleilacunae TaxID=2499076 RepID=A0ABX1WY23_9BACT|nr:glycoside hydrolase family 65 protein [Marinifilum caeruleilacunae]NOU60788.1 glycoside hydrolase family 65 protein [Marinifilum caeruleilacunae]
MKSYFLKVCLIIGCVLSVFAAMAQAQKGDEWNIIANDYSNYTGISIANGRIGIVPSEQPGKAKSIILNHVFDKESKNGVSKVLLGINFANLEILINGDTLNTDNCSNWKQILNMKEAAFVTSCRFKDDVDFSFSYYALRGMPYCGMIDVKAHPLKNNIKIQVGGQIICPAAYKNIDSGFRVLKDLDARMPILQTVARSPFGKHQLATSASFIFDDETPDLRHQVLDSLHHQLMFSKNLQKGEDFQFAWTGAVCTSQDFSDPKSESERMVIYQLLGNKQVVINRHKQLWNKLWQGDIVIEGDLESQQDVRLALYHLYAFARDDSNLSIAPMGLSAQGYNGHVFWDTELWMFPPLLVFNQSIAESLLNYRFDRLEAAKRKAQNYGFDGAMFPWESDETGEEATPTWALTGTFEHHITADIGIAFWNYYRVTGDKQWLANKGYPLLKEVADFWVSRAMKNKDGSYSINNVVGANEFYHHANDNAFTNASAKTVLNYAVNAANSLGKTSNPSWKEVANGLLFHYNNDGVRMENREYKGEIIKQADVNLLAYPLEIVTDFEDIRKDLEYYEPRMAPEGPAMSHSILSVLYSRMGESDKAYQLFKRAYVPNKRAPFGALSESAFSNNPYFATGAGGMLQAVIFGFGGLHISEKGIEQKKPCLPKQWKKLTIKGVGPELKTFEVK